MLLHPTELLLHSNDDFLVVNKPAGLATLPGSWEPGEQDLRSLLEGEFGKLWVVHRLDKITSGVILFAKNPDAHRELNRLFEAHEVSKTYHAILCGIPDWRTKTANQRLRVNVGHSHRTTVDARKGQEAYTQFKILEWLNEHILVEAAPKTGRTHQIRAHASALEFPILGDWLYHAPPTDLIQRPALHARSLEFTFAGEMHSFSAPQPKDFMDALEKLRAG